MLRIRRTVLLVALALIGLAMTSSAHADNIQITLTQTTLTGYAGTTITFDATIANLTASTIFLNGDSSSTSSLSLVVNDNPFLTNAPLSLAAGASSGPFPFFNVNIAPGTSAGTYTGTFAILGGATGTDFSTQGSVPFTVLVSPVPEPGTLTLLASGAVLVGIWKRRKSSHA